MCLSPNREWSVAKTEIPPRGALVRESSCSKAKDNLVENWHREDETPGGATGGTVGRMARMERAQTTAIQGTTFKKRQKSPGRVFSIFAVFDNILVSCLMFNQTRLVVELKIHD